MNKTTSEIRQSFLDFFAKRDHQVVKSASLIPQNDPSLMFNNAGMVQFKDIFTGKESRNYVRAASSQKCIRISGKHNDLEAVGPSPRHHTFFEMLGNFSFGDYFKEEAIVFAWDYLTKELCLPKERLLVTYFEGDSSVPRDDEAARLWKKLTGWGDDRILALGADNFWQMGDTGPCGPCSEIFFCNGPKVDPSRFSEEQDDQGFGWMEVWNLVFMQFERTMQDGSIKTAQLPKPSIDTGAGLERLASVVQGKSTNYGVDLLQSLVLDAARIAGKPYGASMSPDDVSMRVIADHARTSAFLIAEGLMPDKTGREYVLRRVLRRAIRHGHRLGIAEPFMHQVADLVIENMGPQYPELVERKELIQSVILGEEVRFRQTIERGLSLLNERFESVKGEAVPVLSGEDAFRLHDTFGFPLDLTEVICKERGIAVDQAGYDEELSRARLRSSFVSRDVAVEAVYRVALDRLVGQEVSFTGYDRDTEDAEVVALIVGGASVESVEVSAGSAPVTVEVVTDKTCFYAESGGQVGDRGVIEGAESKVLIEDTIKPLSGLYSHKGQLGSGRIAVGERVTLKVDQERREATRRNHSATHLLHWALRKVLGGHAQQKGSLVGPDRLRFDFTHNSPLSAEQTLEIERLVNQQILLNHPVRTEVLSMDQARGRGAMMIFEEKYGDVVRMLTMGPSTELCGGTHARFTGNLGLFKISAEQGVAAGVRRLIATTGMSSLDYVQQVETRMTALAQLVRATPDGLSEKVAKMIERQRNLEREIEALKKQILTGGGAAGIESMLGAVREIHGVKVLGVVSKVSDRSALRELAEQLRDKLGEAIVLVGAVDDSKAALVVTVSKSLTGRFQAGELIKLPATKVAGTGGGRSDMAQAGGTDGQGLEAAVAAIYEAVQNSVR